MAYASRAGHAITNPDAPDSFFQCDRDGFWYNRSEGQFQFDFRGPRLMNIQIFVCRSCLDKPYEFNRPIVTPADPIPIKNPRPAQTNTGDAGFGMGAGWSVGPWSVGSDYVLPQPIPNNDLSPPQIGGVFDDE
ncbi:MAG: hypothetical protein KGL39_04545 [Patescibacteria group bacterium]|nr:hypothetical protein [Patescibacteria group bacterium]